jgi:hypothetical protein
MREHVRLSSFWLLLETYLCSIGEYWTGQAHTTSDNRGKMLRRDAFGLAEERYGEEILTVN